MKGEKAILLPSKVGSLLADFLMKTAQRIQNLPPYLFAQIEKQIEDAKKAGKDIISLGIGDPDMPTPDHIVDELCKEAKNPENHQYPSSQGMFSFRKTVADWYKGRFGVELDPDEEVVSLIGSKEGIAHISLCFTDPGDINLVPDPGYPVYSAGTLFAGGTSYTMPLLEENGFLPDLGAIPEDVAKKAKIMFLNYPNNPTGALATADFFKDVVRFAKDYDVVVCHDAAYTEIAFDGIKPISFLEIEGAKDVGIEFSSPSKTYNMTGWRIGWAVGARSVIEPLRRLKTNIDSGVFQAVQYAAMAGLTGSQDSVSKTCKIYKARRDQIIETFNSLGWNLKAPAATIYIWAPVPKGHDSISFAAEVFEKAGVVITPGIGYGKHGEGYFRMSLAVPDERLREALKRLKESGIRFA
jgi:LL-diaminopimelate aminotransferase